MATLASLVVKIIGDTGQLVASLEKAERRVRRFAGHTQQLGRDLTKLTAPLVAMGVGAAAAAVSWEDAFAGVRKTVDGTEDELARLEAGLRSLSKGIPVSANELAKIGEAAGQLGIHKESILSFTRTIADLAATTNLSSDQAATALAQIANITGMPQDQFDRLGATVVELGNKMATTEAQIVEYGLRIAGAGELAGLTEPQMLAIGAAMASVGVEAEAGGTAIQKVLLDMTQAVAQGGTALGTFADTAGLSALEFRQAFETDAAGAFAAFVEGLGRQGDGAFRTMESLGLADQRVMRGFLSLANAGDLLRGATDMGTRAWQDNVALTAEAEKRYGTTASQLRILLNEVRDTAVSFGTALLPALRGALDAIRPLLGAVQSLGEKFAGLSPETQKFIVAMALIVGVIGPVIIFIAALITSITTIVTVMGPVVAVIGSVVGAIGSFVAGLAMVAGMAGLTVTGVAIIIAAIVALIGIVVVVIKNWETLAAFFTGLWDGIKKGVDAFWGAIAKGLRIYWETLSKMATAVWNAVAGFFTGLWDDIKKGVESAWNGIASFLGGLWDGIVAKAKEGVNSVIGVLNGLIRAYNKFNSLSIGGVNIGLPDIPEIPKLALGVQDFPGGAAIVGERGPELVRLPAGSDVVPNHRLGQAAGQTIVVNVSGNTIFGEMDLRRVIVEAVRDHALAGGFHAVPGFSGA